MLKYLQNYDIMIHLKNIDYLSKIENILKNRTHYFSEEMEEGIMAYIADRKNLDQKISLLSFSFKFSNFLFLFKFKRDLKQNDKLLLKGMDTLVNTQSMINSFQKIVDNKTPSFSLGESYLEKMKKVYLIAEREINKCIDFYTFATKVQKIMLAIQ